MRGLLLRLDKRHEEQIRVILEEVLETVLSELDKQMLDEKVFGGTTAVVALFLGGFVALANTGDSTAVQVINGKRDFVTEPHNPGAHLLALSVPPQLWPPPEFGRLPSCSAPAALALSFVSPAGLLHGHSCVLLVTHGWIPVAPSPLCTVALPSAPTSTAFSSIERGTGFIVCCRRLDASRVTKRENSVAVYG